jgi:hypothetical protein
MDVAVERLSPGAEHGGDPDLAVEMSLTKLKQRLTGRFEEQVVDKPVVELSEQADLIGQGEDDMEVADRKQLALPSVDPFDHLGVLALRAVAIATGVIRDSRGAAVIALIDVATERRRAAAFDVIQDAVVMKREFVVCAVFFAVEPEYVSKFKARSGSRLFRHGEARIALWLWYVNNKKRLACGQTTAQRFRSTPPSAGTRINCESRERL